MNGTVSTWHLDNNWHLSKAVFPFNLYLAAIKYKFQAKTGKYLSVQLNPVMRFYIMTFKCTSPGCYCNKVNSLHAFDTHL